MKAILKSYLLLLGLTLYSTSAFGQFEDLTRRIEEIELRAFNGDPVAEDLSGFHRAAVESRLIAPLRWELKKLELQQTVLEEQMDSTAEFLAQVNERQNVQAEELRVLGVTSEEDLQEVGSDLTRLKQRLNQGEREVVSLQKALELERAEMDRAFQDRSAQTIELQEKLVALAAEELEKQEQLVKQGIAPTTEIRAAMSKLLLAKQKLVDIKSQQTEQSKSIESAFRNRLQQLEIELDSARAELEAKQDFAIDEAREKLLKQRGYDRTLDYLQDRQLDLQRRLSEVNLQHRFLSAVIAAYKLPEDVASGDGN